MQSDQILTEIRQIREDYAKSFNYDLHSMCEDLRKHQAELAKQGWQLVSEPVESPTTQPFLIRISQEKPNTPT